MDIFAKIAEDRIKRAMEDGAFDDLKGVGSPLNLEDETWISEDLRLAYRVLKNAGCIPPELEKQRDILNLRELINTIDDDRERIKKIRELNFRIMELNLMRKKPLFLEGFPGYEQCIIEKLTDR